MDTVNSNPGPASGSTRTDDNSISGLSHGSHKCLSVMHLNIGININKKGVRENRNRISYIPG